MISVLKYFTSDNADALAGTDLDPVPSEARVAVIYIASTQIDTIVSVQTPSMPVARLIACIQRTNGIPDLAADAGLVVPVLGGSKLSINIDIVTGATVGLIVQVQ